MNYLHCLHLIQNNNCSWSVQSIGLVVKDVGVRYGGPWFKHW